MSRGEPFMEGGMEFDESKISERLEVYDDRTELHLRRGDGEWYIAERWDRKLSMDEIMMLTEGRLFMNGGGDGKEV